MANAFSPGNLLSRFIQFIIFGVVTATPYLVKNLDQVAVKVQQTGAIGIWVVIAYFRALMSSTFQGLLIGLSTIFNTIININTVLAEQRFGTLAYTALVLIFATLFLYQPIRLIFNIIDMQKGRQHSAVMIGIISLIITMVVASPIAYLLNDGTTITSGIKEEEPEEKLPIANETVEDTLVNSINLLEGG